MRKLRPTVRFVTVTGEEVSIVQKTLPHKLEPGQNEPPYFDIINQKFVIYGFDDEMHGHQFNVEQMIGYYGDEMFNEAMRVWETTGLLPIPTSMMPMNLWQDIGRDDIQYYDYPCKLIEPDWIYVLQTIHLYRKYFEQKTHKSDIDLRLKTINRELNRQLGRFSRG